MKGTAISHILPTGKQRVSLPSNIPSLSGTFVTIDEPALIFHYNPKAIVYITVHSWCEILYGLGPMYKDLYPSNDRVVSLTSKSSVEKLYL